MHEQPVQPSCGRPEIICFRPPKRPDILLSNATSFLPSTNPDINDFRGAATPIPDLWTLIERGVQRGRFALIVFKHEYCFISGCSGVILRSMLHVKLAQIRRPNPDDLHAARQVG